MNRMIPESVVDFTVFLRTRQKRSVIREQYVRRPSETARIEYDAETDRLTQFVRGQITAAQLKHNRKAS